MNNMQKILKEEIELAKPDEKTIGDLKKISEDFLDSLRRQLRKKKIDADVFVGGSLAKNTIIRKNKYDIDVFVRFSKKYNEQKISGLLGKMLKKAKKIHGSRDYFQMNAKGIIIEIIPVIKIKKPEETLNTTDLSYFHVQHIIQKIKKNKKLADEIRLAKSFAHGQSCYGAESYIRGFSGYSLELLICHYNSFLNFVREISKFDVGKNKKLIVDSSGFYRKKENIFSEMNKSKLNSPIILIDPTYRQRNALAGLSYETFRKFKKACEDFLKNPSRKFFEKKEVFEDFKNKKNLKIISIKTNRQKGDIAGTKSKKFYDFFIRNTLKEFKIKKSGFYYNENENLAYAYLIPEKKNPEIIKGPSISSIENSKNFKKVHADAFIKEGFIHAKITHNLNFEKFFKIFLKKNKKNIQEMSIKEIKMCKSP